MDFLPGQIRVLITRDVDLQHEMDCGKRNLLLNSTDTKHILLDFMDLFELIEQQAIEYNDDLYYLHDVCEKPEGETSHCKARFDAWQLLEGLSVLLLAVLALFAF